VLVYWVIWENRRLKAWAADHARETST
jgi:hypothetical protein